VAGRSQPFTIREIFMDEKEKPITDKENFPSEDKQTVFLVSRPDYRDGYLDGYKSCLTLLMSFLLLAMIIDIFKR
jgi:hypothetical protein